MGVMRDELRERLADAAKFLRRPDMAHDAKRERLASLVERAGAAPQEAREGEPHGVEARDALGVEKLMSELARIARLFRSASELGSAVLVPIAADIDNARATIKALAAARPAPETREPEAESLVAALRAIIDMAPAEATEASDESARCTCEWMSPEDGSVHARWPAVLDSRCAVHSREEAESEAALPAEATERSES